MLIETGGFIIMNQKKDIKAKLFVSLLHLNGESKLVKDLALQFKDNTLVNKEVTLTKNILIPEIKCMVSEIGKIVSNKCLNQNISLNTLKLERLLILMQIEYIRTTRKAFFQESIVVPNQYNTKIKEIDEDFSLYAVNMNMIPNNVRFCESINLLIKQEEIVDSVINKYGNLDSFELEKTPDIQLIHKISEELNVQNLQPPLIFYGLGRFTDTIFEEKTPIEKQGKVLEKRKTE